MPKKDKKILKFTNKPFDFILLITVLVMLSLGIVMVLSASAPSSLSETGNSSYKYVEKQAICAAIGLILMWIISKIDYRIYAKFYKLIYVICIVLLLSVLITGFTAKGANRWLELGFLSFQPSELVKVGLIIFFATLLTKNKDKLKQLKIGFIYPLLWLIPIVLILLLVQNHLSASVVILLIVVVMMLVAGSRLLHFVTVGAIGGIIGAIGLYIMTVVMKIGEFRLSRITTFLNPWSDPEGDGWQVIQGLYAIGSGGLFGAGLRTEQTKIFILTRTS